MDNAHKGHLFRGYRHRKGVPIGSVAFVQTPSRRRRLAAMRAGCDHGRIGSEHRNKPFGSRAYDDRNIVIDENHVNCSPRVPSSLGRGGARRSRYRSIVAIARLSSVGSLTLSKPTCPPTWTRSPARQLRNPARAEPGGTLVWQFPTKRIRRGT
jgi:hypothetical protein